MKKSIDRLRRLFGMKTRVESCKPSHKWTSLIVEQLESRDLLSLPAPAVVLQPASNPALPVAFQVFNPPVANLAIDAHAPQLATLTNQAGPNNNLAATGYQFSTLNGANAGQDTSFQVFGQTNANNAVLGSTTIQELDGDRAVVTLGANLPNNSMYLVWAENAAGYSLPFEVNHTDAWWIGPTAASSGSVVSVYGENLSNNASNPQSWIYLQPAQGLGQWITPTAVNPYKVDFVVPAGLAAGSYQVWVNNGLGGQYGWSSPVNLTVAPSSVNYGHVVVNLSNFAGGLPNTGVDALPAINAALAAIGNNGPATILLQPGTYYLSGTPYFAAGYNRGVYLKGAGQNTTIFKALPGFNAQYFMKFGPASKATDLTIDTTGATLSLAEATNCDNMTNITVIAHGYHDVQTGGPINCFYQNCTFIGIGIYLTTPNQVTITGCNFYATNMTDALVYIWGGNGISFTNNTAQDFNVRSNNPADHGRGRFFVGSGIWGTQSNVYIADNSTIDFSQPAAYSDQNTGEQIMWEGNHGTESSLVTSATSTTATLASLSGDYVGRQAVIVGGKGTGQVRTITATDFANSGSTLTLDAPWDVTPDATSRINIVTTILNVVIYHNSLQGNGNLQGPSQNGQAGSASCGIEIFQGGFNYAVVDNTISNLRYGINAFSYDDNSGTSAQPLFSNIFENNTITNCYIGLRLVDLGNSYGERATNLSNIYRNNTMSGIQYADWYVVGQTGTTMDLNVFELNRAVGAPFGIYVWQPSASPVYLVAYDNNFSGGRDSTTGSEPFSLNTGYTVISSGNMFANFPVADNFNQASSQLSANWTVRAGTFAVSNNRAIAGGPDVSLATFHGLSLADVTVQADVTVGAHQIVGLVARYQTNGSSYYLAQLVANATGTSFSVYLYYFNGSNFVQLNSPVPTVALGHGTLLFEVIGGELKVYYGPVGGTLSLISYVYDSNLRAAGLTGIRSTKNVSYDNYSAGAVTLATSPRLQFAESFTTVFQGPELSQLSQLSQNWDARQGNFVVSGGIATAAGGSAMSLATVHLASTADVSVQADVHVGANQYVGLVGRYQANGTYYIAQLTGNASGTNFNINVYYFNGSGFVQLNTSIAAVSSGTGTMLFKVVGSGLKVFYGPVGGTLSLVTFVYNSNLTAAGSAGMRASSGATVDNFTMDRVAPTTPTSFPISDAFTQADGSQLSNNWTQRQGNYSVSNNTVIGDNAAANLATVNNILLTNTSVQADVTVGSGQYAGVIARYQNNGGYYLARIANNGTGFVANIYRYDGSSYYLLGTTAVASGTGTLKFEVVGSSLRLYYGPIGGILSLVLTVSDSTYAMGLAGVWSYGRGVLDNYSMNSL